MNATGGAVRVQIGYTAISHSIPTATGYDKHGHITGINPSVATEKPESREAIYGTADASGGITMTWDTDEDGIDEGIVSLDTIVVSQQNADGNWQVMWSGTPAQASGDTAYTVGQDVAGVNDVQSQYDAFGELIRKGVNGDFKEYYDYDNAGHLWRTNSGDGIDKVALYDVQGHVTSEIRGLSVDLKLAASAEDAAHMAGTTRTDTRFDLLGRMVQQTQTERNGVRPVVTQKVDRWGNVTEVTDPRSAYIQTTYRYNARNQLIEERLPDAAGNQSSDSPELRLYYDQLGRNVAVRDANGNVNGQVFDAAGNLVEERHADGGVVRHGYDAFNERVVLQDAMGNVTRYTYDQAGQLVQITRPDSTTVSYRYDEAGRKLSLTNGAGETTRYRYDSAGNLTTVTQPLGQSLWSLYDARHHKIGEVDANGFSNSWDYDYFGQLTAHRDLAGVQTAYSYNAITRQLQGQTSTRGQNLSYSYDDAGQLTQLVDHALNKISSYGYDLAGNRTYESMVQAGVLYQSNSLKFDAQNRLTDVAALDGLQVHIDYDRNGNRLHETLAYQDNGTWKGQSLWYAYDAMNRQVLVDGAVDGNAGNLANLVDGQGHLVSYDKNGNRTGDLHIGTQIAQQELHGVDESGNAVTLHRYASQRGLVRESYRYDSNNRLTQAGTSSFDSAFQMQGADQDILLDVRQYDGADRLTHSGPVGLTQGYADQLLAANVHLGTTGTANSYDANGRSLHQTSYGVDNSQLGTPTPLGTDANGNPVYDSQTIANDAILTGAAQFQVKSETSYDSYDGAGNLKTYHVTVPGDGGYTSTYTYEQARFDGYQEGSIAAERSDNPGQPGKTTDSYDVNGTLTGLADANKPEYNRSFITDAAGVVLQKVQEGHVEKQLVVGGQVLGTYGSGTDPSKNINDDGSPNYIAHAEFNLGYQAIDSTHPGATQGTYTVRAGDTLQGIAQQVYGDSQLWYLIADANGTTKPQAGETLLIPNRVGSIHNDSKSFKPYEPGRIVGDTTPNLPAPAGDDGGCGGIGAIIEIVVAVVVAYFAPQLAPELFESLGAGGTALAAGIGDVAAQAVGNAVGIQHGFNWEEVALAAVSAGVGDELKGVDFVGAGSAGGIGNAIVRGAVSNALTQGIGVATGLQQDFNWMGVAAAAAGAGVGEAINQSLLGKVNAKGMRSLDTDFAKALGGGMAAKVAGGTISGFASGLTVAALNGGRVSVERIASDAFGNALGGSIVDNLRNGSQQESELTKFRQSEIQAMNAEAGPGLTPAQQEALRRGFGPLTDEAARQRLGGSGTTPTPAPVAAGADDRSALLAAERRMLPQYYTSRRGVSYTVQPGDTLDGILGSDVTQVGLVAADNGLKGSTLRAGQTIFIADKDQYSDEALQQFQKYGQALYNQDNARLDALRRQAELQAAASERYREGNRFAALAEQNSTAASAIEVRGSNGVGPAPRTETRVVTDELGNVILTEEVAVDNRPVMGYVEQMQNVANALHVPQGFMKNSYDRAVQGYSDPNASLGEKVINLAGATAMLPLTLAEEAVRGALNIPSEAAAAIPRAAQAGTQLGIALDSSLPADQRVIGGLGAVRDAAGAFTGLAGLVTAMEPGMRLETPVAPVEVGANSAGTGAFLEGTQGGSGLGRLTDRTVNVSGKGLAILEEHVGKFPQWEPNQAMVQRLRSALEEGRPVSGGDAVFYTHEIAEATKMRQLVREGLSFDDAYKIAHPATIQKYGVSEFSVYHPDVIQQFPGEFNSKFRGFWGIK